MIDLAILVFSCDKYSDIWEPFFTRLNEKWLDNKYKIYLLSNHLEYVNNMVETICVGDDVSWSYNVKCALKQIKEKYILTMFDDLFLQKDINNCEIDKIIEKFIKKNMNYFRLNPLPMPTGKINGNIGIIKKGELYRSSAVFSLWKKDVLFDVLNDNENAWQFEIVGSSRTDKYDDWYSSTVFLMPYYNLIIKGKYDPMIYKQLIAEGVNIPKTRDTMNLGEQYLFKIKNKK